MGRRSSNKVDELFLFWHSIEIWSNTSVAKPFCQVLPFLASRVKSVWFDLVCSLPMLFPGPAFRLETLGPMTSKRQNWEKNLSQNGEVMQVFWGMQNAKPLVISDFLAWTSNVPFHRLPVSSCWCRSHLNIHHSNTNEQWISAPGSEWTSWHRSGSPPNSFDDTSQLQICKNRPHCHVFQTLGTYFFTVSDLPVSFNTDLQVSSSRSNGALIWTTPSTQTSSCNPQHSAAPAQGLALERQLEPQQGWTQIGHQTRQALPATLRPRPWNPWRPQLQTVQRRVGPNRSEFPTCAACAACALACSAACAACAACWAWICCSIAGVTYCDRYIPPSWLASADCCAWTWCNETISF